MTGRPVLVAGVPEGVHPDVEVTALAQGPYELRDVDTCSAVDGRGVFLRQDVDAHGSTLVRSSPPGDVADPIAWATWRTAAEVRRSWSSSSPSTSRTASTAT